MRAFMCTSVSRFIVTTICPNHTLFNQYSMGIPHFLIRSSVDGLLVCCFGFHKKSSHNSYPSFYVAVFSHCLCLWIGLWSHDHFLNSNFFEQCSMKPENTLSFILVLALDQDLIHAGQCSASELLVALKIKHSHWLFSHSYFFYISELS